uniref:C2H2-type domain-containing protein n=1 Tax=Scophthalmus maximus TaxID=52904 RepID=A0A8D3E2I8_SCOMX
MVDCTGSSDEPTPPLLQVQAPDEGRDLLTCGQCSQAFPLGHILAFIQHKQGGCRSRSQAQNASATPPSPANRAQQRVAQAKPGPGFIELRRGEPSYFTCQQCEGVFPSAWALLQHAQHTHSFSIYQEDMEGAADMRGGEGLTEHKPAAATLDPRHLSQALASAFQPSSRPLFSRRGTQQPCCSCLHVKPPAETRCLSFF